MKVVELFCGTKSFSKVAESRGHKTFTVDIDPSFEPDLVADINQLTAKDLPKADVIWASPPCESFSVCRIGRNWNVGHDDILVPKTGKARESMALLEHTIELIEDKKPKFFFIENPRGAMRKQLVVKKFNLVCVTYCQYGDTRMKPTDIFTNADIKLKPMCKNGDPCHVRAPRGSRTTGSTQGAKNAKERAIVPEELCLEIIEFCEKNL